MSAPTRLSVCLAVGLSGSVCVIGGLMSEDRERVLCRGEPLRGEVFFFAARVVQLFSLQTNTVVSIIVIIVIITILILYHRA